MRNSHGWKVEAQLVKGFRTFPFSFLPSSFTSLYFPPFSPRREAVIKFSYTEAWEIASSPLRAKRSPGRKSILVHFEPNKRAWMQ